MKIVVFAPHAAIWIHAFPEALVAEALAQSGHEVAYVTCDRQFHEYCVAMTAHGVSLSAPEAQRVAVCDRCRVQATLLRDGFALKGSELGGWLRSGDESEIAALVESARREDPCAIQHLGVPIGRFALYQFLIRHKKMTLNFSDPEWAEYRVELTVAARAAAALSRMIDAERPDRLLLYNGLYSVNLVASFLAERSGAIVYSLHAGGNVAHRLQTLMVGRDHAYRFYPALLRHWPRLRERPIGAEAARTVTDHFVEALRGRSGFVYSAAKSGGEFRTREHFGIPAQARILVATLSSYDEEFAAEAVGVRVHERPLIFPRQSDWIHALCELVGARPDLFLIIRVHPREFPNRREAVHSEHGQLLRQALADLPPNVKVNWPDERISLYDLAEEADVFLNAWSSVGKEMSLVGCPVVTYVPELLFYPSDLNYAATSRAQYFDLIERALAEGWSAEHIRRAYRWLAIEYIDGLVDIADGYGYRETQVPRLPARVVNRLRRALDPLHVQRRDMARRPAKLRAAGLLARLVESGAETVFDIQTDRDRGTATAAEEDRSLREQIGRLLPHLYPAGAAHGRLRRRLVEFAR